MTAHQPVLLNESIDVLLGSLSGVYLDATFGRGGHTCALLARLSPEARVIGMDRDPAACAVGAALAASDPRFAIVQRPFATLGAALDELGVDAVHGVLMDLGVSSPQLDDPARGFSFRFDGPLDMRMDPGAGLSASAWLDQAEEAEIARVLFEYGEERFARRIAAAIIAARPITTTSELVRVVRAAQPRGTPGKHEATRTFQALRIVVNNELGELETGMAQAFARLCPGGRLAVISFHSLEDRLVKRFFRARCSPPELPRRLPVRGPAACAEARLITNGITPSATELGANPRARSARLRVLEKLS